MPKSAFDIDLDRGEREVYESIVELYVKVAEQLERLTINNQCIYRCTMIRPPAGSKNAR